MTEGDTEGMVFHDADGNAYDADNHPVGPLALSTAVDKARGVETGPT